MTQIFIIEIVISIILAVMTTQQKDCLNPNFHSKINSHPVHPSRATLGRELYRGTLSYPTCSSLRAKVEYDLARRLATNKVILREGDWITKSNSCSTDMGSVKGHQFTQRKFLQISSSEVRINRTYINVPSPVVTDEMAWVGHGFIKATTFSAR
jgi:hypothetical protein